VARYKVQPIVNRYDRHAGLSKDVLGTALHTDIYHIMLTDYVPFRKP
jgi:hypothetical protein